MKLNYREVNGEIVPTVIEEINGANLLFVEVGTNGKKGGDSGYGCRTYIKIVDESGTDIKARSIDTEDRKNAGIEIMLGGDSELNTIIEALKFCTKILEQSA